MMGTPGLPVQIGSIDLYSVENVFSWLKIQKFVSFSSYGVGIRYFIKL